MTSLDISGRDITSLVDYFKNNPCPNNVRILFCDNNQLTTLAGCPNNVRILFCVNNQLTTLAGCPSSVTELYCDNHQLTTLAGCPSSVTKLLCFKNRLTTLVGCPNSVTYIYYHDNNLTKYPKTFPDLKKYNRKILWRSTTRSFKIVFGQCITIL